MAEGIAVPIVNRNREVVAETIVDAEDAARIGALVWSLHPRGYAQANIDGKRVLLHRFILEIRSVGRGRGSGAFVAQVDHINGDKLDNRKANLRVVTNQQNHQNRRGGRGSSQHRGVYWNKRHGKWMARVKAHGKTHYFGVFDDELEAAAAARKGRELLLPLATD